MARLHLTDPAPSAAAPPAPDDDWAHRAPVLCAVLSVALNARQGLAALHDVDNMRVMAEELLPRGDGLRTAVLSFATRYEALRRDAYALRLLGEELQAALQAALDPEAAPARPYWGDRDDG